MNQAKMEIEASTCGKYTIIRQLGSGFHAKVKLILDPDTQTYYALKVFKATHALAANIKALAAEINILKTLNHPNLVNLIDHSEGYPYQKKNGARENRVGIVLELAAGGELFEYVAQTGRFSMPVCRYYFKQLIGAMEYIHNKSIVHRDIKPENLLFDTDFNLKVADFGFATLSNKYGDNKVRTQCGTAGYMAPEIINKAGYDGKLVDIFACGVVLFIMFAGSPPFSQATPTDPYYKLLMTNKADIFWNFHSKHKNDQNFFPPEIREVIIGMLQPDPSKRWTIEKIQNSAWFQGATPTAEEIKAEFTKRKQAVDNSMEKERIRKQIERQKRGDHRKFLVQQLVQKGIGRFRAIQSKKGVEYNFDHIEMKYQLNSNRRKIKNLKGDCLNTFFTYDDEDFLLCYLLFHVDGEAQEQQNAEQYKKAEQQERAQLKKQGIALKSLEQEKYKATFIRESEEGEIVEFTVELKKMDEERTALAFTQLEGDRVQFYAIVNQIKELIIEA